MWRRLSFVRLKFDRFFGDHTIFCSTGVYFSNRSGGNFLALDVSISFPTQSSLRWKNKKSASSAKKKMSHLRTIKKKENIANVPFALEISSGVGLLTESFTEGLSLRHADYNFRSHTGSLHGITQSISVELHQSDERLKEFFKETRFAV